MEHLVSIDNTSLLTITPELYDDTHTHTHTHIYIYREREGERQRERGREMIMNRLYSIHPRTKYKCWPY